MSMFPSGYRNNRASIYSGAANLPKKEEAEAQNTITELNNLVRDAENEQQRLGIKVSAGDSTLSKISGVKTNLVTSLTQNPDIHQRIKDIVNNKKAYEGQRERKLRDIATCLSLLPKDQKLNQVLKKIDEISPFLSSQPEKQWQSELDKVESLIRASIPNPDSFPAAKSQLLNKRNIKIDDKIFGMIHAESLIKGSQYEGYSSSRMISFVKDYLQYNGNRYSGIAQYKPLLKMLQDAEAVNLGEPLQTVHPQNDIQKRLDFFSNILEINIKNLRFGEKTLMDTGWVTGSGGHSMKLMIEKEKGGTLLLTLFNTGAGIENHVWLNDRGEKLVQPFIEISGVDIKRFLDPDNLQALLEFKLVPLVDTDPQSRQTEYSAKDVYAFFLKCLGGKVLPCQGDRAKFITPQVAGTCTYSSLLAVFNYLLPPKDYYKIACGLAFDSLCADYQNYHGTLEGKEEARILLQHGLVNMAQVACDAFTNGAIDAKELAEIYTTLKELQNALENAENAAQAAAIFNQEVVFKNYEPIKTKPPSVDIPDLKLEKADSLTGPAVPQAEASFSFDWIDHPYSLTSGLQYLNKTIRNAIDSGNSAEGIYQLERFFALQAANGRDILWSEIPEKDLSSAMIALTDLSECLCDAAALYPDRMRSYTMDAYYLAALGIQLSQKMPELKVLGQTVDPTEFRKDFISWSGLSEKDAPAKDTTFFTPEDRILRQSILDICSSRNVGKVKMTMPNYFFTTHNAFPIPPLASDQAIGLYDLLFIDHYLKEHPMPGKKDLSRQEAITAAYCDWYGDHLPPAFCAFRRQHLIASSFQNEKPLLPSQGKLVATSNNSKQGDNILLRLTSPVKRPSRPTRIVIYPKDPLENEVFKMREEEKEAGFFSEADIMATPQQEDFERHLRLMLAQGDEGHLEMQIVKGLAYFSDHYAMLADRKKQTILRQLIFENNYLETVLESNPNFGTEILKFAEKGREIFLERNDMAAAAFFIELGRDIDAIILALGLKGEPEDFRSQILDMLQRQNLTTVQRSHLFSQLSSSYESHPPETFEESDAILLLTAMMHNSFHPLPKEALNPHLSAQMQRAGKRWEKEIQKLVQSQSGDSICNAVLMKFCPQSSDQRFDCKSKYPLCVSQDGHFAMNVASFEIFEDNKALTGLPQSVLQDPLFRKFFKQDKYTATRINNNCYEFVDERSRKTQVITGGETIKIRHQFLGMWYQMASYNPTNLFPEDFENLCKEKRIWIPVEKEEKPTLLICNEDLKITHFFNYKDGEARKIQPNDTPLQLVDLREINNKPLEKLLGTAMLWADKEGKLKELDIASLNLAFTMSGSIGKWRAECKQFPGYFLSHNQSYRGLHYVPKGIVLENELGKRKLILPYGTISPTGTFSTKTTISGGNSIAFDLDKNSLPIAKNREQKLYLANLLFVQKDYTQAQKLLRQSHSLLTPPSMKEQELIKQIIMNQEQDASPHAMALAITALALLPASVDKSDIASHLARLKKDYVKLDAMHLIIPHLEPTDKEKEVLIKKTNTAEETITFPTPKTGGKKQPFNIDRVFIKNSRLNEDQQKLDKFLVTRSAEVQLSKWLQYAKEDPLKLELMLIGAEHNPKIPKELIDLLRAVSHGFSLNENLLKPDTFLDFAKRAERFEAEWQAKQPGQAGITLKGQRALRIPRGKEKQEIGISAGEKLLSQPLKERKALLPVKMLKSCFAEIDNTGLQLTREELDALKEAVDTEENDPLAEHIESYWTAPKLFQQHHGIKDSKSLEKVATHLGIQSAELGKQVNFKEQELLAFANEMPDVVFATEKLGQLRQEITLRDLILFTARSRHFSLTGKNPAFEAKKNALLSLCLQFLDLKAEVQQTDRALIILDKMRTLNHPLSDPASNGYKQLSQSLYTEITRMPAYKAHLNPELLVLEVLEEIGLHDWQVKDLERMISPEEGKNRNIILEKVMGSGKSKVYLPLLALSKADGDHLAFVIVHSSQAAMEMKNDQLFGQVAHPFRFSRESDTSVNALKALLLECEKVQSQRHFFVATDKAIHSLGLAFDELWHTYLTSQENDPVLEERIEVMRDIINLIRTKGKATLDEADLLLNCRYEVVYALGHPEPLSKPHADFVSDLYQSIASDLAKFTPFTEAAYKEMKPHLIDTFVKARFKNDKMIASYLKGEKAGADYVSKLPDSEKDLLAVAYYEFKELLPFVLEKRCGEHYGFSDDVKKVLPVPYIASGIPSPTSEYSFPYALLNYTMQTLIQGGVTPHILKGVINDLQLKAEKERKMDPRISLKETAAYQEFLHLCEHVPDIPFLNYSEKDIEKLAASFKKDPDQIYPFAKKYLFPFVQLNPFKLGSTPYSMCNMFFETDGFTGTAYNRGAFPDKIKTILDPASSGKTEGIIWKNSKIIHNLISSNFEGTIKENGEKIATGGYGAFIDVGAIFNGQENLTVAENLLGYLPKETFKGILFYKDNRPYVMEHGREELIPYEKYDASKPLFILYDQYHTTGTDFTITGKSLLSFGKNTTLRDLMQGYMRDRQAELGERIEFILSPETQSYCKSLLKTDTLDTAGILRVAKLGQDAEVKMQLMMGTFARLNETARLVVRQLLCSSNIPLSRIKEDAEIIDGLIIDAVIDAPWEQFGGFQEDIDTKVFFDSVIQKIIDRVFPLYQSFSEDPPSSQKKLKTALEQSVHFENLPKMVPSPSHSVPEQLVEKQSVAEIRQEQTSLVQKEQSADLSKKTASDLVYWPWFTQSCSNTSYWQTTEPSYLNSDFVINGKGYFRGKQTPFAPISSLLSLEDDLREFSDLFDIEASYNFLPYLGIKKDNSVAPKKLFQKGHLEGQNMLLCKNLLTGKQQVRIVSQADHNFFFEHLSKENDKPKMEVTLYNLSLGVTQSNIPQIQRKAKDPIDDTFRRKIVQAKFLNGESFYSPEELPFLKAWIKEKGAKRLEKLFLNHIVKDDPLKFAAYAGSPLSELLS